MKKTTKKKAVKKATRRRRTSVELTSSTPPIKARRQRRTVPPEIAKEIDRRFDFVAGIGADKTESCIEVRAATKRLAQLIGRATPINREQSLAITKLEEALHFAIASIVRPQGD